MTAPELFLASTSPSRAALLRGAGLRVTTVAPGVDEAAAKPALRAAGLSIADQAMQLAEMKAVKISQRYQGLVIGADQMLACEGQAFDKPADRSNALRTLQALQGRVHTLETAIVIAENGQPVWRHLARPRLTMRAFDEDRLSRYLDLAGDGILSTVGAYKLEDIGVQLFSRIEGDYFSILGLPLLPLLDYLRERGVIDL
jgi:septum formation protein